MSLPEDLNTVVVTGRFIDASGAPLSGTISFAPSEPVVDAVGNVIVDQVPDTIVLDSSGSFSEEIVSTDNPNLNPQGWAYIVHWRLNMFYGINQGVLERTVTLDVPSTVNPVDLSRLVVVEPNAVYGGEAYQIKFMSASGNAAIYDRVILADATDGNMNIALPPSPRLGEVHTIKKVDSTAHTVGVSPEVDGVMQSLASQYQAVSIIYNGSVWYSID